MRFRFAIVFFCSALILIVGCAQVQQPKTEPLVSQTQLQSASHWQNIAKKEAVFIDQTVKRLKKETLMKDTDTVYISEADRSAFGVALRRYLTTELMSYEKKEPNGNLERKYPDVNLVPTPSNTAFTFAWDTQLVNRSPWRPKPFYGLPAFIIDLVGTILVGGGWHTTDCGVPHTELVLTTTINLRSLAVASNSETYFINDEDGGNYWQNPQAYASAVAYSKSIRAKDDAERSKFAQTGQLAQ